MSNKEEADPLVIVLVIGIAFSILIIFYLIAEWQNKKKAKVRQLLYGREHGVVEDEGVLINTKID